MAKFEVIVRAIIRSGNKVLLGKKGDVPHPLRNQWHFIGGRLEHGEDPWDGIVREVKEEVGIDVKPIRLLDAYTEYQVWPSESKIPPQHVLHLIFECIPVNEPHIKPANDIVEAKWFDINELSEHLSSDMVILARKNVKKALNIDN